MIETVRTLFGLTGDSGKRTVVGSPVGVDIKAAGYIRSSHNRLNHLKTLGSRYKGTPHEFKIKTVHEKTQNIHNYLVGKNRFTELEMFHLQNTDHFINTFALIIEVHQKNKEAKPAPAGSETPPPAGNANTFREFFTGPELVKNKNIAGVDKAINGPVGATPQLSVPDIFLDTYAQISYIGLNNTGDVVTREIGITASAQEKEAFVAAMAARIGLYKPDISYVGNALIQFPNGAAPNPTVYVPVINWKGYMYALDLNDYRLYPVRIYRKNR
ncbi:MAG: hypothetical protein JWQ14_2403 [Adhaeribacter sp.]|nr:hypothetical protein [Adhaeribacter sp.]